MIKITGNLSYFKKTIIVQNLQDFNLQFIATQDKEVKKLDHLMPAGKKASDLLGDDTKDLSTENETLKNKIGSYDEKCRMYLTTVLDF